MHPCRPPRGPDVADAPVYQYDPNVGNPRDAYIAPIAPTWCRRPEVAGQFVAFVEGQT